MRWAEEGYGSLASQARKKEMGTGQDPTGSAWQTQVRTLAIWCHSRLPVYRWSPLRVLQNMEGLARDDHTGQASQGLHVLR